MIFPFKMITLLILVALVTPILCTKGVGQTKRPQTRPTPIQTIRRERWKKKSMELGIVESSAVKAGLTIPIDCFCLHLSPTYQQYAKSSADGQHTTNVLPLLDASSQRTASPSSGQPSDEGPHPQSWKLGHSGFDSHADDEQQSVQSDPFHWELWPQGPESNHRSGSESSRADKKGKRLAGQ